MKVYVTSKKRLIDFEEIKILDKDGIWAVVGVKINGEEVIIESFDTESQADNLMAKYLDMPIS